MSSPVRPTFVRTPPARGGVRWAAAARRAVWVAAAASLALAAAPVAAQQPLLVRHSAYVVSFAPGAMVDDLDAMPLLLRQPITLRLRDVTVERALQAITARAGITLAYSRAVVPLERRVSVSVQDGSVLEALQQVLGNSDLELWVATLEDRIARR